MEVTMNLYRGKANQSTTSNSINLNQSQMIDSGTLKSAINFNSTGRDFMKPVGKFLKIMKDLRAWRL